MQLTCHRVAFSIELLEWGHPLPGYWRSENSDTVAGFELGFDHWGTICPIG